jgi:hypothetical protein
MGHTQLLYDPKTLEIIGTVSTKNEKNLKLVGHEHRVSVEQIDFRNVGYNPRTKRLFKIKKLWPFGKQKDEV